MKINSEVFNSVSELQTPSSFQACLNAHGLYHSRQFALRLSPRNHELIKSLHGKTVIKRGEVDELALQAYSTFVHENIHWWQHKGSISGFIRSLAYPSFSHTNMGLLNELTSLIGPKKPLFKWWDDAQRKKIYSGTRIEFLGNSIINNFMDVEFFLGQTYNPEFLRHIALNPYFESVAHCTWITYSQVLQDISQNVDKQCQIFPSIVNWEEEFADCRDREISGHYHDSVIHLAPLGLLDILEGQARLIQLQYLCFGNGSLSLKSVREGKYLENEYGRAFDFFLSQVEAEEPSDINDPLIALFLLLCDIALNPSEGFISQIEDYENFHINVDPGYRFLILCSAIAVDLPHLKKHIKNYSKEEYIFAARQICDACGYMSPYDVADTISHWTDTSDEIRRLMQEHAHFKMGPPNPVTRLLLAELISFFTDKVEHPHFFCWPGAWMAGSQLDDAHNLLWLRHLALYSDQSHSTTIVPREVIGCTNEAVNETFNNFYGAVMTYDFMRQWIHNPRDFDLDYNWLIQLDDLSSLRTMVSEHALKQFGINLSDFTYC